MKFAGNYHGATATSSLAEAGSGLAALGLPGSAGVTAAAVADTRVAPYNVIPELDDDIACVIVEPVAANMGLVPAAEGFARGPADVECDRVGALLVFDEVITGLRLRPGGVQEATGIAPDLTTFGKVIGGGLNIGAYGGRRDVMQQVAPSGLRCTSRDALGEPARHRRRGLAALSLLDAAAYVTLVESAERIAGDLRTVFDDNGIPAVVTQQHSLVGVHFGPDAPMDYETAQRTDTERYARFFHAALDEGRRPRPGRLRGPLPWPRPHRRRPRRARPRPQQGCGGRCMTDFTDAADAVRADLTEREAVRRLLAFDHTLWRDDPTEISDRLGWIPVVAEVLAKLPSLTRRCDALVEDVDDVVVMGMGGSSLFPEVLARTFEPGAGHPRLHVLDTTDPAAIQRIADTIVPDRTLFVASSKSGSTHRDPQPSRVGVVVGGHGGSLRRHHRSRLRAGVPRSGARPRRGLRQPQRHRRPLLGPLPLRRRARPPHGGGHGGHAPRRRRRPHRQQRRTGGRASLRAGGGDGGRREERPRQGHLRPAPRCRDPGPVGRAAGRRVARQGRHRRGADRRRGRGPAPRCTATTACSSPSRRAARACGRRPPGAPKLPSAADPHAVGWFVVTTELAVALVGAAIGVQPFDQPDVAAAKAATNDVLASGGTTVELTPIADLLAQVRLRRDLIALQVFSRRSRRPRGVRAVDEVRAGPCATDCGWR